jgi:hypothetical protein
MPSNNVGMQGLPGVSAVVGGVPAREEIELVSDSEGDGAQREGSESAELVEGVGDVALEENLGEESAEPADPVGEDGGSGEVAIVECCEQANDVAMECHGTSKHSVT